MYFDSEDSWFCQEFFPDDGFVLQGEDYLFREENDSSLDQSEEGSFNTTIINFKEQQKCSLTNYPDLKNIKSEPLVFPKEIKERKRNFSWSIATKFEDEEKFLKFKDKITFLCNKVILIFNYDLGEMLGYLNFNIEQSKEGFHSFFPGVKFVPARGGCNNNAELFLDYLKNNPNSKTLLCLGFSPEIYNVLSRY